MSLTPQQAAAQELLRRESALADMRDYRQYIEPSGELDFKFAPAAHHDVIIDALHFLEYGQDWDGNPVSKVLIMLPPGAAKSTYGSIQFATWYAARNPTHNILACSNTTDLAEGFNRRRRNVLRTSQWESLSESRIDQNAAGVGRFQLTAGGSMTASGVGSSIVGLRANLLLIDDPIQSFEQAMSSTQLDKIWAWYESDARSRLLPDGKELMITTRWARNDPAGRILDLVASGQESWHIVRLPMLCDDADNDPLGRELNAPLWPDWFSDEQIARNQRNPLLWSSQYQQVPLDESGSWVGPRRIHLTDESPHDLRIVIGVDIALSVGKGDYTVFVVAGLDPDRNIHILDVIRGQWEPSYISHVFFELQKDWEPDAFVIDDDNASKVLSGLLGEIGSLRSQGFYLKKLPLRGRDKETRASTIRGMFMRDSVFIRRAPWTSELLREVHEFPSGDHDDQIDCLSLIGRYVPQMSAPVDRSASTSIRTLIQQTQEGSLVYGQELNSMFSDHEVSVAARRRSNRI